MPVVDSRVIPISPPGHQRVSCGKSLDRDTGFISVWHYSCLVSEKMRMFILEKGRSTMKEVQKKECSEKERRDFLRKSAYAAYATPVIAAMLVEKASAAQSGSPAEPSGITTPQPTFTGGPPTIEQ